MATKKDPGIVPFFSKLSWIEEFSSNCQNFRICFKYSFEKICHVSNNSISQIFSLSQTCFCLSHCTSWQHCDRKAKWIFSKLLIASNFLVPAFCHMLLLSSLCHFKEMKCWNGGRWISQQSTKTPLLCSELEKFRRFCKFLSVWIIFSQVHTVCNYDCMVVIVLLTYQ